jgi:hypothetical protein
VTEEVVGAIDEVNDHFESMLDLVAAHSKDLRQDETSGHDRPLHRIRYGFLLRPLLLPHAARRRQSTVFY